MNLIKWPLGCLSQKEWDELLALEYILTWNYSDDKEKDEERHKYLSELRWNSLFEIK